MYEATKKKNEKLTGLDNQMVQVEEDFNEMMRKRDEEKRKLELKFKDVYQWVTFPSLILPYLANQPTSFKLQENQRHQAIYSWRG